MEGHDEPQQVVADAGRAGAETAQGSGDMELRSPERAQKGPGPKVDPGEALRAVEPSRDGSTVALGGDGNAHITPEGDGEDTRSDGDAERDDSEAPMVVKCDDGETTLRKCEATKLARGLH